MFDLKPLIFVMCRLTALFLLYRERPRKPSAGIKIPLREREAHAFSASGIWKVFCPKWVRPLSNQPFVFLYTSGRLKRGWNPPKNRAILSAKLTPPFPERGHTQSGLRADIQGRHKSYPMPPRADASPNPRRLRKSWAVWCLCVLLIPSGSYLSGQA